MDETGFNAGSEDMMKGLRPRRRLNEYLYSFSCLGRTVMLVKLLENDMCEGEVAKRDNVTSI
jgi:hypothetical protein